MDLKGNCWTMNGIKTVRNSYGTSSSLACIHFVFYLIVFMDMIFNFRLSSE